MPEETKQPSKSEVKEVTKVEPAQLPAERMKQRGIKKLQKEDQMIPRLKVMQGLSPEVQDGIAKYGDLVNSLTKENYGKTMLLVPIDWWTSRIYWKDRKEGGGIVCRSFDGQKGNAFGLCEACGHKEWTTDEQNNQVPSDCTKIFNILCAALKEGKPIELVVTSFLKTSFKYGKEWVNVMNYKNVDLFNYQYEIFTENVSNDMGTYNVLRYRDLNQVATEEVYKRCEAFYNQFGERPIKIDDIEPDQANEKTKDKQMQFDF